MARDIRKFEVGVKGFILDGHKLLMLEERGRVEKKGRDLWELPGGRIDVGEENLPIEEILFREVKEELGLVKIEAGNIVSTWVRQLHEDHFVFLIGLACKYIGGEIVLSDEHASYKWVDRNNWSALNMADGYRSAIKKFWETN